ncbi:vesicle transport v-SNARE 11 isoform X1 [Brachypodium distachyon]|uniref:vesicle transport v-SNARE 11 isoform X1 n=1 Tax=Brachypodium distachyon TaxID=15368 RepID=UPI000D0D7B98|nr:vesicle transport v-SNARE 11 isoform X1 [Brachypodium distachyon]|eukprot:XP_024315524.1 vesicle transport v-SNARE 11 isoform X1 [Brachypodium distachyon]
MSEVFEGYERQYCEISASLSRKCTAASSLLGEKLKQKASEIKSGIDGAEALIRKMDLEARNLQPSVRAGLLAKLREYKSDLNNLKGTLKRITTGNAQQGTREELLESGMADTLVVSADQRSRLLRTTEKQNQTTDRIRDSHRTMLETEDLGVSILHDLHQQRQSLLRANDTLAGEEKLQIPTPQYPSHLSSIYVRNATRRLKRFLPKRHSPRPPDPDSLPFPFHERRPRYGSGATGTPPEICAAPPACGRTASRISPMAAAAHMKRAAPWCSARVSLFTDGVWRRRAAAWMADGVLGRSGGAAVVHG